MRQRKRDHITPTFRVRLAACAWLHSPQAARENLPHSLSSFCHTLHPVFSDQRVSHLLMYQDLRIVKRSNMASKPSVIYYPFPVEFPTQEHQGDRLFILSTLLRLKTDIFDCRSSCSFLLCCPVFQGTWVDEATGVKKNEQKLVVSAVSRPNPAVTSWNKRVRG